MLWLFFRDKPPLLLIFVKSQIPASRLRPYAGLVLPLREVRSTSRISPGIGHPEPESSGGVTTD